MLFKSTNSSYLAFGMPLPQLIPFKKSPNIIKKYKNSLLNTGSIQAPRIRTPQCELTNAALHPFLQNSAEISKINLIFSFSGMTPRKGYLIRVPEANRKLQDQPYLYQILPALLKRSNSCQQ